MTTMPSGPGHVCVLGFLTDDDLTAALTAWLADPCRPFGDFLRDTGRLTPD